MKKQLMASVVAMSVGLLLPMTAFAEQVKLEEGTKVLLSIEETVGSNTVSQGQSVTFRVVDDVMDKDMKQVLIKAGSKATGQVADIEKSASVGKPGEIRIQLSDTRAVDGTRVRLRGSVTKEGSPHLIASVVLTVIFFPIGLLFLLIKGGNAKLNNGFHFDSYVDNDVLVNI